MNDDPLKAATSSALLRLLEPLTQLAMEVGIAVGDVQALIERAFVSAARSEALQSGEADPQNVAHIAVRTGLHRSTVRQLLDMKDPHAVRIKPFQNFSTRVIWAWCREADYVDPGGVPKILPLRGKPPSFQALIKLSVGDELSRTILKDLQRVGAVRRVRGNQVQLVRRTYAEVVWSEADVTVVGEQLREYVRGMLQVLQRRSFKPLYRHVICESLDPETAAILERDFSNAGQSLFNGFGTALTQEAKSSAKRSGPKNRLSAQIMIVREPVVAAAKRSPRKKTR